MKKILRIIIFLLLLAILFSGGFIGSFYAAKKAAEEKHFEQAEKFLVFGSLYDCLDPSFRTYLSACQLFEKEDWYTAGPIFAGLGDYLHSKDYYDACLDAVTVKTDEIRFYRSKINLTIGDSYSLGTVVFPSNATNKLVDYYSSDDSIVTVDGNIVSAVGVGQADVFASQDGKEYGHCQIIVDHIEPTEMFFKHRFIAGKSGSKAEYELVFEPTNTSDHEVEINISDDTIATVEGKVIFCVKPGTTTVTVFHLATGLTCTCELIVSE